MRISMLHLKLIAGSSTSEMHAAAEDQNVYFVLGQNGNAKLLRGTVLDRPGQNAVCRFGKNRAPLSLLGLSGENLGVSHNGNLLPDHSDPYHLTTTISSVEF